MTISSIASMTGFASKKIPLGESTHLSLEVKSLNGRYLDLKPRIARELSSLEPQIRTLVQKFFERGNFELKVEIQKDPNSAGLGYELQEKTLRHYYQELTRIQKKLKIPGKLEIKDLIQLPEVLSRNLTDSIDLPQPEQLWKKIEKPITQLLQDLKSMRIKEGTVLQNHLLNELASIRKIVQLLRDLRKKSQQTTETKISERVKEIFEAYPIRETNLQSLLESRIAQELAFILDRSDIEEELTRLAGHVDHFVDTLKNGGTVGRKLEFLLQEMHREVNTLGTKAQDLHLSDEVVQLKVKIEQIREQVLNIE